MKGVYELRPALPKHNQIWDPGTVLQFLMKSSPLSVLSLKQFTLKLVMLTALVTGQRCQSIYLMDLSSILLYTCAIITRSYSLVVTSLINQFLNPNKNASL